MTSRAAAGAFILLVALPGMTGRGDWAVTYTSTHICALKGSTASFPCTFTYPTTGKAKVTKRFWFIEGKIHEGLRAESQYRGRVVYEFYKNDCTLMIKDLRESDSTEYKFRFTTNRPGGSFTGSPGVSLSVTDLWVQATRSGDKVELRCRSGCDEAPDASYVWYRNDRVMKEETSTYRVSFNNKKSYSCAVYGHEEHRSLQVYAPKLLSVSVSPSGEIVEGRLVTLTCSSDANPAASYTWYKKDENKLLSEGPQLIFSSIQSSDSGEFYCEAENHVGIEKSGYVSIIVKYAPRLLSVSVSSSGEIVEGSSVNLTCSSDANPAANFTWYKEDEERPKASGHIFIITDFRDEHSGNYYCEAQNTRGRSTSTFCLIVVAAGAWRLTAVATVPAFFLAVFLISVFLISVFLWIIKKRSTKPPSERGGRPDTREQVQPAEPEDGLHYGSVHFSKKQADPVYSNTGPAQPPRQDEEPIVYAAVTFSAAASRTRGQEAEDDPAALYSTVNKKMNL